MINELTELLKSSINKSVELKLFKNKEDSSYAHLYNFKLEKIPMAEFKKDKVKNFSSDRLKAKSIETAYPEDDRPKGMYNIESVKYHMTLIDKNLNPLIFIAKKNNKYELIHGTHKIVAAHLAHLKKIDAYVIYI